MSVHPLQQNPLGTSLKSANEDGRELFKIFVTGLNEGVSGFGMEPIWYQADDSKFQYRYFWMFLENTDTRDFITRLNFISQSAIRLEFSHFGGRLKGTDVELMPNKLVELLQYKGSPPHVRIDNARECERVMPLIVDHFKRISNYAASGGKLPRRGWSHIEILLKRFLQSHDNPKWSMWAKPDFLDGRQLDIVLETEKIAIELQGDYWHKMPGQPERDQLKREAVLAAGWKLMWVWESAVRSKGGINFSGALQALEQIRDGARFVEVIKIDKEE